MGIMRNRVLDATMARDKAAADLAEVPRQSDQIPSDLQDQLLADVQEVFFRMFGAVGYRQMFGEFSENQLTRAMSTALKEAYRRGVEDAESTRLGHDIKVQMATHKAFMTSLLGGGSE